MGIQSLSLLSGATLAATGGTPMAFVPTNKPVPNGVYVVNSAQTDFRVRENITAKYKEPTLSSDGTYSKGRHNILYVEPFITAAGKTVFNLVEIRQEVHPELSASDATALRHRALQLGFDTDMDAFWAVGSTE